MAVRVAGVGKQVNRRTDFGPLRPKTPDFGRSWTRLGSRTTELDAAFSIPVLRVWMVASNHSILLILAFRFELLRGTA